MLPPSGRHPGPGPAPCRPAGAKAAPQPERRPIGGLGYGRPSCEPATANAAPSPSRPARCEQATTPPTDHAAHRPAAPGRGGPPHEPLQVQRGADRAAAAPRTLEACPSGHLDALDTGRLDVGRPLDRLDGHPHGGPDEADRATTGPAGVRTSRDRRHPLGGPTAPGSRRLGALGHPRLLRGDGTCAAALTAAATGQLPSPARHEAAPRRTALVCWIWMVRGEGNGTTERRGCTGSGL